MSGIHPAHTRRARKAFGPRALAHKCRASTYRSGHCSVCLRVGCRRKWQMVIGTHEGFFFLVKGQGHTWKDAWASAGRSQS